MFYNKQLVKEKTFCDLVKNYGSAIPSISAGS